MVALAIPMNRGKGTGQVETVGTVGPVGNMMEGGKQCPALALPEACASQPKTAEPHSTWNAAQQQVDPSRANFGLFSSSMPAQSRPQTPSWRTCQRSQISPQLYRQQLCKPESALDALTWWSAPPEQLARRYPSRPRTHLPQGLQPAGPASCPVISILAAQIHISASGSHSMLDQITQVNAAEQLMS